MKIVLAFDSFKGSLTSREVAHAFSIGFRRIINHCEVCIANIADGGEGTLETLVEAHDGLYINKCVSDPLGRPVEARYGIIDNGNTAVIEMAAASGLTLLADHERNPMKTTTYGTGELIADAIRRGCSKLLIGIGGSATNDGGVGMLRALGYKFLDAYGNELIGGGEILSDIFSIDDTHVIPALHRTEITVACDVNNPLYGVNGAAHVYAPQKGADKKMVEQLDDGLRNYAKCLQAYCDCDVASIPGAGAAGGMGAGLIAVMKAQPVRGVDMVLDALHFENMIEGCNYVITGEGRMDKQTVMGKAPGGVLRIAQKHGIPTIAVCGIVDDCIELQQSGFAHIVATKPPQMPIETAMQPDIAIQNIIYTSQQVAEMIQARNNLI